MKVVSTPQNRPVRLSQSRTLHRSERRGQGWRRLADSFGRGLLGLRPPEQAALGALPGLPLQIRARNNPAVPLWVRLLLVIALVGLWYGFQRTLPLPFTAAGLRTTLSAAASTVGVTGPGDSSGDGDPSRKPTRRRTGWRYCHPHLRCQSGRRRPFGSVARISRLVFVPTC